MYVGLKFLLKLLFCVYESLFLNKLLTLNHAIFAAGNKQEYHTDCDAQKLMRNKYRER